MKTILIFFLLGLTLSYDREAVAKCIDDYNEIQNAKKKENSNEKTPNLDRDKDSAKIIGHCMYSAGKADFNGCNQNRDEHGNFLSSSALRDCLISKGWKKSKPLRGNPVFMINTLNNEVDKTMIVGRDETRKQFFYVNCCCIQSNECRDIPKSNLEFYTKIE